MLLVQALWLVDMTSLVVMADYLVLKLKIFVDSHRNRVENYILNFFFFGTVFLFFALQKVLDNS